MKSECKSDVKRLESTWRQPCSNDASRGSKVAYLQWALYLSHFPPSKIIVLATAHPEQCHKYTTIIAIHTILSYYSYTGRYVQIFSHKPQAQSTYLIHPCN